MVSHYPLFRIFKTLIAALVIGVGLAIPALPAVAQTRILFVGNSFTHGYIAPAQGYNAAAIKDENYGQPSSSPRYEGDGAGPWGGVPGIFKKLTDEAGLNYEVHIEAINGVTLQYHYDNALSVIQQTSWDRVVLQELSTGPLPANRGGNLTAFFNASTLLEQAVHAGNPAAKIYLYETWARADLTYPAGQPYSGQPIETMGNDLHAGYYQALAQNAKLEAVAPAGDAWLRAIQAGVAMRNPYSPTAGTFDLWSSYFHASELGSYLSANVLFYQITGVDPRTLGAAEQAAAAMGISQTQAVALQQIAYEQVSATIPPAQYALTVTVSGSGTVAKNPAPGPYASGSTVELTATPGAGQQFSGWGGDAAGSTNPLPVTMTSDKNITATFTAVPAQQVTSFTLVNATTNADIQTLTAGATLNLATLPTRNLNIRANTNPATVGSVVFALSGAATQNQTDSAFPYALFLDNGGVYNAWTPPVGSYTLSATPYTTGGGTGQTFYRGINVNGGALTLDGQSWVGSSGAANLQLTGSAFANQGVAKEPGFLVRRGRQKWRSAQYRSFEDSRP